MRALGRSAIVTVATDSEERENGAAKTMVETRHAHQKRKSRHGEENGSSWLGALVTGEDEMNG